MTKEEDLNSQQKVHCLIAQLATVCEEAGWSMIAGVEMGDGQLEYGHMNLKRRPADKLEEFVITKLKNRHL